MKKYKHIFFDLDRTLYDFDKSTHDTFLELFNKFNLYEKGVKPFERFFQTYSKINLELWDQYRKEKIEKAFLNVHRFYLTLKEFDVDDRDLAARFANDYLALSPLKKCLFPGVMKTLEYLSDKYRLHIITNGFEEVQTEKIKANGLNKYFTTVTTSEEAGVKKPFKEIFLYALQKADAKPEESLMIGDDIAVDILGAKSIGMDQMFFNNDDIPHNNEITFEVKGMEEIIEVL